MATIAEPENDKQPFSAAHIGETLLRAFYGEDALGRVIGLCPCVTRGLWPEMAMVTDCNGDNDPDDRCADWPDCTHRLGAATVTPESPGWCVRCGEYISLYRLASAEVYTPRPAPVVGRERYDAGYEAGYLAGVADHIRGINRCQPDPTQPAPAELVLGEPDDAPDVYVLTVNDGTDENAEGGEVLGVYSSLFAATAEAQERSREWPTYSYDVEPVKLTGYGPAHEDIVDYFRTLPADKSDSVKSHTDEIRAIARSLRDAADVWREHGEAEEETDAIVAATLLTDIVNALVSEANQVDELLVFGF